MFAGRQGSLGRHSGAARRERGAAAVEFALVVPLLVALMLGVVTAGLSYSHALGLTNAVREGARFGATSDASDAPAWAADVLERVRATQFDDPTRSAEVCVQLWKIGTGPVADSGACDPAVPTLGIGVPAGETADPAVPSSGAGSCVVRVIAAREFTINIGIASWTSVHTPSSIARYERKDKMPSCL